MAKEYKTVDELITDYYTHQRQQPRPDPLPSHYLLPDLSLNEYNKLIEDYKLADEKLLKEHLSEKYNIIAGLPELTFKELGITDHPKRHLLWEMACEGDASYMDVYERAKDLARLLV